MYKNKQIISKSRPRTKLAAVFALKCINSAKRELHFPEFLSLKVLS